MQALGVSGRRVLSQPGKVATCPSLGLDSRDREQVQLMKGRGGMWGQPPPPTGSPALD